MARNSGEWGASKCLAPFCCLRILILIVILILIPFPILTLSLLLFFLELVSRAPAGRHDGDDRVSQVPTGILVTIRPALRPQMTRQAEWTKSELPGAAPASPRGEGSPRSIWQSRVRSGGCPLATQDSLPAAGPALPDGIGYPQDSR